MLIKRLAMLFLLFFFIPFPVQAQSVEYPVYVVQSGDSLNAIAVLFGTTTDEIISLNNIQDPNFISEGTPLYIPGLQGISGKLIKTTIPIGQTYFSIAKVNALSMEQLIRINRLTSPNEIFSGATLISAQPSDDLLLSPFISIQSGKTLLETAALQRVSTSSLLRQNNMKGSWDLVDNQVFYYQQNRDVRTTFPQNSSIQDINISPLPLMQGKTIVITVKTTEPLSLTGSLNGHTLNFFPNGENEYIALQGIHRRAEIGVTDFSISANIASEEIFSFTQNTLLVADYFPRDNMLYVDPRLMDPAITEPEDQLVQNITTLATPIRQWDGYFYKPLDSIDCTTSVFGSTRAYNDSAYVYSHSGADFVVCTSNLNIYAVAPGTVVHADFLDVRGNAVIIDHGWGVFSGYWHQSQLMVKVGDRVDAGQIIGLVGTTGRSNGAHLHLEVWVGGVQVEPMDWLTKIYP